MRRTLLTIALAVAASTAVAHDVTTSFLEDGATSMCGKWDYVVTGAYTLYQDLWNEGAGTGSQCTTIDSLIVDSDSDSDSATDEGSGSSGGSGSGDVLAWSTSWSWSGDPTQVKSYANAVTNFTVVHLADIDSIPTAWSWMYSITSSATGDDNELFANVAYDTFTTSSPSAVAAGKDADFEVMVWVATFGGAGPLSASGRAIKTGLALAGATWDLWMGYNGATRVYSFVATATAAAAVVGEGRWEGQFRGDLLVFFDYLVDHEGLPLTQYLLSVHAGTESFAGEDAVFSVPSYSCGVSTGGSAAATGTAVVVASSVAAVANDAATATTRTTTTTSPTPVEGRATASSPSPSSSSSSSSTSSFSEAVTVASSSSSSRATASPRHLSSSSSTTAAVTVPVPVPSSSVRPQTGPSRVPGSSSASASAQAVDSSSTSRAAGASVGAASSQPGGYNFSSVATPAAGVRLTAAPAVPAAGAAMTVGTSPTTLATSTVVKKNCRARRAERGEGRK